MLPPILNIMPHIKGKTTLLALVLQLLLSASSVLVAQDEPESKYVLDRTIRMGQSDFVDVAYTYDQNRLVALNMLNEIWVWDIASEQPSRKIETRNHKASHLIADPVNPWVYTGGEDGTLRIWDWRSGNLVNYIRGLGRSVTALYLSRNNNLIFASDNAGNILAWHTKTRTQMYQLNMPQGKVLAMASHPRQPILAIATDNAEVTLWNWEINQIINTISVPAQAATSLAFSVDGNIIATGTSNGLVILWQLTDETAIRINQYNSGNQAVSGLRFHEDFNWVISSSGRSVVVVDYETLLQPFSMQPVEQPINALNLSDDTTKLVAAANAGFIYTWQTEQSRSIISLKGHRQAITSLDFSDDGQSLISSSRDNSINLWSIEEQALNRSIPISGRQITSVQFVDPNLNFITASTTGGVDLWNAADRERINRFEGHIGRINALDKLPGKDQFVSAGEDGKLLIQSLIDGSIIASSSDGTGAINAIDVATDGSKIATVKADRRLTLWTNDLRDSITLALPDTPQSVAIHPTNYNLVAVGFNNGRWAIYDLSTKTGLLDVAAHSNAIAALQFLPGGNFLVTASLDRTLRIWDANSGGLVRNLHGGANQINAMTISDTGELIAAATLAPEIILIKIPPSILEQVNMALAEPLVLDKAPAIVEDESLPAPEPVKILALPEETKFDRPRWGTDKISLETLYTPPPSILPELLKNQEALIGNLRRGETCSASEYLSQLAIEVLNEQPNDKIAYYMMLNHALELRDLSAANFASKVGMTASFINSQLYSITEEDTVTKKLDKWANFVFRSSQLRGSQQIELDYRRCNGDNTIALANDSLFYIDYSLQTIEDITQGVLDVDFAELYSFTEVEDYIQFYLDAFLQTSHSEYTLEANGSYKYGWLDLTVQQTFPITESQIFFLRRGRGRWFFYKLDEDNKKYLILPTGNYYVRVQEGVLQVFSIYDDTVTQVKF